ncbi:polysaccharide deacetylase family protein [Sphingobacterium siyangense]|uniref:polysaccharide deacetylase family protein n=1 Tax=Sphingobacterium siyangense TaxID=459529 RepID=UPI0028A7E81A|nr:polysaccharide deacetylase family protein [Sphingobacterium siyangense]
MALVFTGHDLSEGAAQVLASLKRNGVKGSFFLTGDYLRTPDFEPYVRQMLSDGHWISGHSDKHLLVSDWGSRDVLLVKRDSFVADLKANLKALERVGVQREQLSYYIPSYEWYNSETVDWAKAVGLHSVNYTPGIRTAADYTYPEMGARYVSSAAILDNLWSYETRYGLNGFLILIHMGTDDRRKDKLYHHLDDIISILKGKGYQLVDVPDLLK